MSSDDLKARRYDTARALLAERIAALDEVLAGMLGEKEPVLRTILRTQRSAYEECLSLLR